MSLLGLTSEDLLQSIELQQDMNLCNELQKSIRSINNSKLKTRDVLEKLLNDLRCVRHDNGVKNKMVNEDKEARTVIDLAVEMESTVDQAKDMLTNNCSDE